MARYGCLIISVIIALLILVWTVWLWSGRLNLPTGHAPTASTATTTTTPANPAFPKPITRNPDARPPPPAAGLDALSNPPV